MSSVKSTSMVGNNGPLELGSVRVCGVEARGDDKKTVFRVGGNLKVQVSTCQTQPEGGKQVQWISKLESNQHVYHPSKKK